MSKNTTVEPRARSVPRYVHVWWCGAFTCTKQHKTKASALNCKRRQVDDSLSYWDRGEAALYMKDVLGLDYDDIGYMIGAEDWRAEQIVEQARRTTRFPGQLIP